MAARHFLNKPGPTLSAPAPIENTPSGYLGAIMMFYTMRTLPISRYVKELGAM
jgi:hypothetical protein